MSDPSSFLITHVLITPSALVISPSLINLHSITQIRNLGYL